MPQNNVTAATKSKKKKGRAPAHQNTFAFRHNPKSKKTAQILAKPVRHCCRRCQDKLEWRKKYRKYKPLTQAATCNLCHKRNITAAYHTVCEACSVSSPKAVTLLHTWNTTGAPTAAQTETAAAEEGENVEEIANKVEQEEADEAAAVSSEQEESKPYHRSHDYTRVCAVCFKQPALPSNDDEDDDEDDTTNRRPLKLRELKALRRQKERLAQEKSRKTKKPEDSHDEEKQDEQDDDGDDEQDSNQSNDDEKDSTCMGAAAVALEDDPYGDDDDDDDPFLQAVGGKDKLLTGDAYQKMLLEKLNTTPG